MVFLHGKIDFDTAAAFDPDERLAAAPPDQVAIRQTLLAGVRIEVTPAITVVNLEPGKQRDAALLVGQDDTADHPSGNSGVGQYGRHRLNEFR